MQQSCCVQYGHNISHNTSRVLDSSFSPICRLDPLSLFDPLPVGEDLVYKAIQIGWHESKSGCLQPSSRVCLFFSLPSSLLNVSLFFLSDCFSVIVLNSFFIFVGISFLLVIGFSIYFIDSGFSFIWTQMISEEKENSRARDFSKTSVGESIPAQSYEMDILPRYKEALSLGLASFNDHKKKDKRFTARSPFNVIFFPCFW